MTEPLYVQFATLLAAALLIPTFVFLAHGVHHRNMRFWWVAAVSYSGLLIGAALGALRTWLPGIVTVLVSNILIGGSYFYCLRSLRLIKDEWRFNRIDALLTSTFLIGFVALYPTFSK